MKFHLKDSHKAVMILILLILSASKIIKIYFSVLILKFFQTRRKVI